MSDKSGSVPGSGIHSENYLKWFDRHGVPRPSFQPHGTVDEIREKMKRLETSNWRMEGPGRLVCDTDQGRLVQHISTDYICEGTDDEGLPILKKIVL